MPVTSFAPEFLELFRKAADETITIILSDEKAAIRLRARLNYLRRQMKDEEHPLHTVASTVQFRIEREVDTSGIAEGATIARVHWALICAPADDQFLPALHAAGIKVDDKVLDALSKTATELREVAPIVTRTAEPINDEGKDILKDYFNQVDPENTTEPKKEGE